MIINLWGFTRCHTKFVVIGYSIEETHLSGNSEQPSPQMQAFSPGNVAELTLFRKVSG